MEEKKNEKVKNLDENNVKPEKLTYEQLEAAAYQLSDQVNQLRNKIQDMNIANIFKRLDYLFKVVENEKAFNADFVVKCVEEIESLMTVKEESEESSEE